jgi:thiol-disulfide isomerase/thioredoxin
MKRSRSLSQIGRVFGAVLGLVVAVVLGSVSRGEDVLKAPGLGFRAFSPGQSASEFGSLEGAVGWINADGPIHLDKLRGKVVLLDFWTYCCINCQHVLPDLAKLEAKYKNQLVVIGVHTAKFDAERDTENIRSKVREYQIKHPVANDADRVIWNRFGVQSWPSLVVLDVHGNRVVALSGEGHLAELDRVIGQLVTRARARGELDETPVEFPAESERPHAGGLLYPGKITADPANNRLFLSDTGHNRVVVTNLEGKLLETIGSGKPGFVDGKFAEASFDRPQGTCLFEGVLYVCDTENHALRAVDLKEKTVKTVAGTGKQGYGHSVSGKGTSTPLSSPWDVVEIPGTKVLAVAMAGVHQIWRFDVARGTVASWAGSGREGIVDGTLKAAEFAQPSGLATDGQHLFVADSEVSGVRAIALGAQHRISSLVGVGLFGFGDVDGRGESVRLQHCLGLALGGGKLYIADTYNNKIKVLDPKTRAVKELVGDRKRGDSDEPPLFDEPGGLALAGNTLYVADTNNHKIRAIDLNTRAVRTLDTSSVEPPSRPRGPSFANATVFNLGTVSTRPGKAVTLDVMLALPPGYKLSAEAPMVTLAEAIDAPDTFTSDVPATGWRIEQPAKEFTVRLPLNRQAPTGSTLNLRFSVSAFVCLPNTLCTVKNYVWNVPITFNAGSPGEVKLTTATQ